MASRVPRSAVAVVVVLALVGASAFAFAGFAVAEHRTNVDRQVATAALGNATMSVPDEVSLYVVGPDPVRDDLGAAFVDALGDRGVAVQVVTDLAPDAGGPVLLVGVRETRIAYDPITPSATVAVRFEYVPSGNVSQFGRRDGVIGGTDAGFDPALVDEYLLSGEPIPVRVDDENTLFRGGDVRLTDRTTGVVSWPGYRSHVLDATAESTVAALFAGAGSDGPPARPVTIAAPAAVDTPAVAPEREQLSVVGRFRRHGGRIRGGE